MDKRQEIEERTKSKASIVFLGLSASMLIVAVILVCMKYYYAAMIPLLAMVICAVSGIISNVMSMKSFDSDYRKYIGEKEAEEKKRLVAQRQKEEQENNAKEKAQRQSRKKKRNAKNKKKPSQSNVTDVETSDNSSKETETVSKEANPEEKVVSEASVPDKVEEVAESVVEAPVEEETVQADVEVNEIEEAKLTSNEPVKEVNPQVSQPKKKTNTQKFSQSGKKMKQLNAKPVTTNKESAPKKINSGRVNLGNPLNGGGTPDTKPEVKEPEIKEVEEFVAKPQTRPVPKMASSSSIIDVVYLGALVDHKLHDNVVLMFYTDKFLVRDGDTLFEGLYDDIVMLFYNPDAPSIAISCKGIDGKKHTFVADDGDDSNTMAQINSIVSIRIDPKIVLK